jgi:hypothetical protein
VALALKQSRFEISPEKLGNLTQEDLVVLQRLLEKMNTKISASN